MRCNIEIKDIRSVGSKKLVIYKCRLGNSYTTEELNIDNGLSDRDILTAIRNHIISRNSKPSIVGQTDAFEV